MKKICKLFPFECVVFINSWLEIFLSWMYLRQEFICANVIIWFLDIFYRLLPQRSGRGMMGRQPRWTRRTRSEPRSCGTSTTVSTWSTWPRMRDLMSCWHSNTLWRYETVEMSFVALSLHKIFVIYSIFGTKYFKLYQPESWEKKIIILKNC